MSEFRKVVQFLQDLVFVGLIQRNNISCGSADGGVVTITVYVPYENIRNYLVSTLINECNCEVKEKNYYVQCFFKSIGGGKS